MDEFKSNSYKSKSEDTNKPKKKVEKVVTGVVNTKKKSELKKFAGNLISEDAHNLGTYLLQDVLIPALKNTIEDIVTKGIRMFLRGDTGERRGGTSASKVSYRSYYEGDRRYAEPTRTRNAFDYDELIFQTRGDAELVLESMRDILDTYPVASVADFYELANVSNNNPQTHKYGWTDISSARVVSDRDGYTIKMPRALPLN